jgi:hypothetical protein
MKQAVELGDQEDIQRLTALQKAELAHSQQLTTQFRRHHQKDEPLDRGSRELFGFASGELGEGEPRRTKAAERLQFKSPDKTTAPAPELKSSPPLIQGPPAPRAFAVKSVPMQVWRRPT